MAVFVGITLYPFTPLHGNTLCLVAVTLKPFILLPTGQEKTRAQKHQSMTWAQRLKRVFNIVIFCIQVTEYHY